MKTKILNPDKEGMEKAANIIRAGGTVAFPTETVYGLGANALDPDAIEKIYKAKGRPSDNPLIVHISDISELQGVASDVDKHILAIANEFWPGPLTLVCKKSADIPDQVTGGLDTVAVRMPSSSIAREFIRSAGVPIAAPSANKSGKPSPTSTSHVIDDLNGKIDAVIMGDDSDIGIESTVISVTGGKVNVLRPGVIGEAEIRGCLEKSGYKLSLGFDGSASDERKSMKDVPKSPGVKYKHYSPNCECFVVVGSAGDMDRMRGSVITQKFSGFFDKETRVLDFMNLSTQDVINKIYHSLRKLDEDNIKRALIFIKKDATPEYEALMNRLHKAANGKVSEL